MENKYYIISLKHTQVSDQFITLWNPKNAGYCISKSRAGIYETLEEGYHDSEGSLPVLIESLSGYWITINIDGEEKQVIPNIAVIHKALGLKWIKGQLIRL